MLEGLLLFAMMALGRGADLPPINSPATPAHYPGKFIWFDLVTPDAAGAQNFYTHLFGWDAATLQRGTGADAHPYVVFSLAGRPIAGIARGRHLQPSQLGRWIGFASVASVRQAVAAATAGGGTALSPAAVVPQRGKQVLLTDPEGAVFGLLHSSSGDPGDYLPDFGDFAWAELFVHHTDATAQFYDRVLGDSSMSDPRSDKPGRYLLVSGGYSRATVAPMPDSAKRPPGWLFFVRVANVKDAADKATALGGRIILPPGETPADNWRAVIADPGGARLGLVQLAPTAMTEEAR